MLNFSEFIKKANSKLKRTLRPYFTFGKARRFSAFMDELSPDKYNTVIVFVSNFGWSGLLRQRPQQIASHFPSDVLFIYHSDRDNYKSKNRYQKLGEGLYLADMSIYGKLFASVMSCKDGTYVMTYSTDPCNISKLKPYTDAGFSVIYEYVDMIDDKLCGASVAKWLIEKRATLLASDDVYAVCTANSLYNMLDGRERRALITNGCDYDFFASQSRQKSHTDTKTVVGYYGVLASWFDYELIRKICETGRYKVVLTGNEYDSTLRESGILSLPDVVYTGKVDYEKLPEHASDFDVCIIPFLVNDITLATSPVKLFEYMALGKPVVTTALPECRKYSCVHVAESHEEFLEMLDTASLEAGNDAEISKLKACAEENSWESKCRQMLEFINRK